MLVGLDALGQIGYRADRPYSEETLPVLYDEAVEQAVMGLARRGDPRGTAPLLNELWHMVDDVSVLSETEVFGVVAIAGTKDMLPPLRRLWQRRDSFEPSDRRMLAEALASLGDLVDPVDPVEPES
ncbi:hypothetical protein KGQ20_34895 [Catenulispora sp. NF23]|uniref:Uncharacterized protein n=1 Tax=Catenulispora pinistramenti TaxID=2705254 RepID=A0ABS5L0R3_9ACTN|nr:hypothetical protein [Catenulispora pinistramenti]MBS2537954.1 hypothetical protein [Catenulispora pinistramenti]MBS2551888.1 hypothetical protein [Catenulispora pinistramenti]